MSGFVGTAPVYQFFKNDGKVNAGGKVYTYITGTNTPAATYQDSALTILNANPIVLDSSGRATIWLDGSIVYRWSVKTAFDVLLWDAGEISNQAQAANDLRDDLLSPNGSSFVSFSQSGAGAVTKTVQSELRERVSVTQFGAVMDGITPSSLAMQKAVNYLSGLGGGKLVIPRGDILLDTTVNINCSGITVEGDGNAVTGTRVINGQAGAPAIQFGDGVTQYGRCAVRGVLLAQQSGVTAVSGNCGIKATKQLDFTLDGVDASSYPGALYNAIKIEDSTFVFLRSLRVENCLHDGVILTRCADVHNNDSRSDANAGAGWSLYGCEGVYWRGITAWNNTVHAFRIASDGSTHSFNQFYTNCIGDTSGSHNWNISNLAVAEFTASWGSSQQSTAVNPSSYGFVVTGAQTRDHEYTGCVSLSNNSHGMIILAGSRIKIRGGQFGNPVSGNGKSGLADGINIQPGVTDITVSAQCCGNSQYGVAISSGVTNVRVDGGEYTGNSIGSIAGIPNAQYVKNAAGVNPMMHGIIGAPALPASGVAATNTTGVDAVVYIRGGVVTSISVAGTAVIGVTETSVFVPAGQTISVTYSSAPFWVWVGC